MTQKGEGKVVSSALLRRVFFDVQCDFVEILYQRGGSALIKVTPVVRLDDAFAVSAVVVDNGQITV